MPFQSTNFSRFAFFQFDFFRNKNNILIMFYKQYLLATVFGTSWFFERNKQQTSLS